MDSFSGNLRDPPNSRILSTQLLIASLLGFFAILLFASLRNRFPQIFMARLSYLHRISTNRQFQTENDPYSAHSTSHHRNIFTKSFLNIADKSFFNSLLILHRITDEEIIDFAGLDAYVFLSFFKMAIKLLFLCWVFAVLIISPVRYYFTGDYDEGDGTSLVSIPFGVSKKISMSTETDFDLRFNTYLSLYVLFTYLFTYITCHFLIKNAKTVIERRQSILGKQNSITDRTIRLSGIPPELRTEKSLKETIENLRIGKVKKIVICKEWKTLNKLLKQRDFIIKKLEYYWANNMQIKDSTDPVQEGSIHILDRYRDEVENDGATKNSMTTNNLDIESGCLNRSESSLNLSTNVISTISYISRPKIRTGKWGIFGEKVDAINYYSKQLSLVDDEIKHARKYHYPATPTAFITMDTVATAQTLAQAVLDPRIGYLITSPAPAPADIIWENATLPNHSRKLKIHYITVITGILGVIFIFPVGYLATLLNLKSIRKFWPDLGDFLGNHDLIATLVIDLLPVYLYTFLNCLIPFLYVWLSSKQGFISHGEEELSVVSKNFFYVFVNLFLVFTMAGTASNYWGYLSDSKQLALQLAQSLRGLASFYVDTIVLQGLGLMPFKLLPMGRIFQFIYFWLTHSEPKVKDNNSYNDFQGENEEDDFGKKRNKFFKSPLPVPTPRELTALYKPPIFNFGLQLPHPLLTLVITLIYSIISTKILSSGLVYFIIGYYVYKFLLVYTYVHPQHSTGKVMPIIFRRIILGLLLFQLTVAGCLVLEKAWLLAVCLAPLPFATLMVLWYFQEKLKPLSVFIALRAIQVNEDAKSSGFEVSTNGELRNRIGSLGYRDTTSVESAGIECPIGLSSADNMIAESSFRHDLGLHTEATIDEQREQHQSYEYPPLKDDLEGPWVRLETENSDDGFWVLMWTSDGFIKKRVPNFG